MKKNIETERLQLGELNATHAAFIIELLNTEGWLKFIGDRKIKTIEDAEGYINRVTNNTSLTYRIVYLKNTTTAIGVITFIQRVYLENPDIGFAFLPQYEKKGFAYEASKAVLDDVLHNNPQQIILATTVKDNVNSINLLQKLGLKFYKNIVVEGEELLVFSN
jgi:[ribosomal protein S5]-alanine N-acetyltransferase